MDYKETKCCRICKSTKLQEIINMGNQFVIGFPDSPNQSAYRAPIVLMRCNKCGLVQLKHTFKRDLLYKEYWYQSGISNEMVSALKDVADKATSIVKLDKGDIVLDIAGNDNALLRQYLQREIVKVNIDPSDVAGMQKDKDIIVVNDYFTFDAWEKAFQNTNMPQAKIVTCCAMFYDLNEPNLFVEDVKEILDADGIFIIQINYLIEILRNKTYDDLVHEHIEYYSLKTLKFLLNKHGLEIFDVEKNNVNGGSIRAYIKHKESNLSVKGGKQRVNAMLEWEKQYDTTKAYKEFKDYLVSTKFNILKFIKDEEAKGKSFMLYGASTRGYGQVQWLGFNKYMMPYAIDKNPRKWEKYYGTTGIRIISLNEALNMNPDYLYILPYHFLTEIIKETKQFTNKGTKLLIGIPKFRVI